MPDSQRLNNTDKGSPRSPGMERQMEIYTAALAGKRLSISIPLAELEKRAAEILPPEPYDWRASPSFRYQNYLRMPQPCRRAFLTTDWGFPEPRSILDPCLGDSSAFSGHAASIS
jgi:hypothetical protein